MAITQIQGIIKDPEKLKDIFGSTPVLIDDIPLDVLTSETPGYSNEITARPIEAGSEVTDHIINIPDTLRLDGIFTDPDYSIGNILNSVVRGTKVNSGTWQEKRDRLYALRKGKKIISVVTPSKTYDQLVIANITPEITTGTSKAFFFSVEFKKVEFISSQTTQIDDSLIPKKLQEKASAAAKKTTAAKAAKGAKVAEPAKQVPQSKLDSLLDSLGGDDAVNRVLKLIGGGS